MTSRPMGFINLAEKTVHAKLVYYGIGAGGKTTSLQAVHGIMCPSNDVKLVSIKTEQDATLLFDFLPINLGTVEGFEIMIQGFTVPGQPKYKRMRKYVLQGADAVVLVVDSQSSRLEENKEALESLLENLRSNGLDPDTIPIVIQYNKRDLDDILSEEELNPHFLIRDDVAAFPSVATDDQGVYETFVHAAGQLVEEKVKQYELGKGDTDPEDVAKSARTKLWSIFDVWRDQQEDAADSEDVLQFHVDEDYGAGAEAVLAEDGQIKLVDTFEKGAVELDHEESEDFVDESMESWIAEADDEVDGHTEEEPEVEATSDGEAGVAQSYQPDDEIETGEEVFSDAELDVDLDGVVVEGDQEPNTPLLPVEDGEAGLLDMALQSNLQMAEAFGELDQFKSALRRKNGELIKITENTIHDLNKPLSAIKLMLTSVVKGYFGDVEGRMESAIQNSMAAVEMMERLMGDLMDSIVLDTTFKMKFAEVDLGILITGVLRTLRYTIEEEGVGIRIEPMPAILADEWALTKAFMNLIGNAIQYRSPDRMSRITISYEDVGELHSIRIIDNGIGVPEGERDGLFLRFERGSNASNVSGTGLGLHIVKEAILGHGGSIELESEEGVGTTFTILIPKDPLPVPQSSVTQTVCV